MASVLEVDKKYSIKNKIKRLELEYGNMEYIIINLEEKVIDVDGVLYKYVITEDEEKSINNMIWEYENLDEYEYWPDKSKDHKPMSPMWRISFYDEIETFYHKSGALKYPPKFMELVKILKRLEKEK